MKEVFPADMRLLSDGVVDFRLVSRRCTCSPLFDCLRYDSTMWILPDFSGVVTGFDASRVGAPE